jgi:2-polyprenyl-6-methoxyphenol hydroxylase-like FAD-dependent oxidoreductase
MSSVGSDARCTRGSGREWAEEWGGGLSPPLLTAPYEQLRQPRVARVHGMSAANKTRFHLPDGPEQEKRDAHMASGSTDWSIEAVAWLYGHDAAASR